MLAGKLFADKKPSKQKPAKTRNNRLQRMPQSTDKTKPEEEENTKRYKQKTNTNN